jgi:fructose-specific phosphotransferase system IIC component
MLFVIIVHRRIGMVSTIFYSLVILGLLGLFIVGVIFCYVLNRVIEWLFDYMG